MKIRCGSKPCGAMISVGQHFVYHDKKIFCSQSCCHKYVKAQKRKKKRRRLLDVEVEEQPELIIGAVNE